MAKLDIWLVLTFAWTYSGASGGGSILCNVSGGGIGEESPRGELGHHTLPCFAHVQGIDGDSTHLLPLLSLNFLYSNKKYKK